MPRLLRACHDDGLRVVLASSADPRELDVPRAVLDYEDAIDEITSAADLLQIALGKAGAGATESVSVGDAAWDALACQKAGVRCLGC